MKPSELPKYSVIEWVGLLYVKYTDDMFMCINPQGHGRPFLIADDPLTKGMHYLNMSTLPSDRFFNNNFKDAQWGVVSLPMAVVERLAYTVAGDGRFEGLMTEEEIIIEAIKESNAQANKEGTRPASPSADEGQPGEP